MNLEEKLSGLPDKPGVYLMKDSIGRVLYVGKAASLRSRIRSYFQESAAPSFRIAHMLPYIADLDYVVTDSEKEALILECNLIKKHRPYYNVRLRDDKNYPYLKITYPEPFPRIMMTRRKKRDGAEYFGPYTSSKAMWKTLRMLKRLFGVRTCKVKIEDGKKRRPCLDFHIGQCLGPCAGQVSQRKYKKMLEEVSLFLRGKQENLINKLQTKMQQEAKRLNFERAARLRDQIQAIQKVVERQKIVSQSPVDQDIMGMVCEGDDACIQVLTIREGKLLGEEYLILDGVKGTPENEILSSFVKQYYSRVTDIPKFVVLQREISDPEVVSSWLSELRGSKVEFIVPKSGERYKLLKMALDNAAVKMQQLKEEKIKQGKPADVLLDLQEILKLSETPYRIEAFDISNIMGKEAVGSMVVFENAKPLKQDYRRFKIKTKDVPDDYAMLKEVVKRRYLRGISGAPKFKEMPNLVLIDGGKGQLNCALEALQELDLSHLPVVSLAKEYEHIFLAGQSNPIILPKDSKPLRFLQLIRDEAHRFAIRYHLKLRDKLIDESLLDQIPGVGEKRKRELLKYFGSLEEIRKASLEQLTKVPGITQKVAQTIRQYLK